MWASGDVEWSWTRNFARQVSSHVTITTSENFITITVWRLLIVRMWHKPDSFITPHHPTLSSDWALDQSLNSLTDFKAQRFIFRDGAILNPKNTFRMLGWHLHQRHLWLVVLSRWLRGLLLWTHDDHPNFAFVKSLQKHSIKLLTMTHVWMVHF